MKKTKQLNYNSGTVLPMEIMELISETEKRVQNSRLEGDKINCAFGYLTFNLVKWFAENQAKA
jgi:hypothetical protein